MNKPSTRAKLPLWKKILFSLLLLIPVLLLAEVTMRLLGYGPAEVHVAAEPSDSEPPLGPTPFGYFAVCDENLGFRNRPDGTYRSTRIDGNPVNTTDEFGFRNGFGWTAEGDGPIVLFVGDSFVFAAEVNDDETPTSEVAKLLQDGGFSVRVLNAGVRGYGTLQAKRMMVECLERFPEIEVVVYTHCGNDLEENVVPNFRYPAKTPVVVRDQRTGRFREIDVTEPTVAPGESFLTWQRPPQASSPPESTAQWLQARSALCYRLGVALRRFDQQSIASLDPNEIDDMVLPADVDRWRAWAERHDGYAALQCVLAEMGRICEQRGVDLVVTSVTCGLDLDLEDPRRFAKECKAAGVPFVTLEDAFTDDLMSYMSRRTDGRIEEHFGTHGTATYAAVLAPVVERLLAARRDSPKVLNQHETADQ
ncbi:MAG: hypothetical protein V3R99_09905 [Thermoguttaceae bacterium]